MLIREHVDADGLDRARHEHRHKRTRSKRRASLIPSVRALAETESTLLSSRPEQKEQQNAGSEPEDVREIRDVRGRLMRGEPKLGEGVYHLKDDEEADHDQGGQLKDRDEDPEEHKRRYARRREHHNVRAENAGDRTRGTD